MQLSLTCVASGEGEPSRRPARAKRLVAERDDPEDDDDLNEDSNEMICTWLQCDRCSKWRIVPDSAAPEDETQPWYCENNVDRCHNRCSVPQQPDDAVGDFSNIDLPRDATRARSGAPAAAAAGRPLGSPTKRDRSNAGVKRQAVDKDGSGAVRQLEVEPKTHHPCRKPHRCPSSAVIRVCRG